MGSRMPGAPAPGSSANKNPGCQGSASPPPLTARGRCSVPTEAPAVGTHPQVPSSSSTPGASLSLAPSSPLAGCPRPFCPNCQRGFLVFYYQITNHHKHSNLKQHKFIVPVSAGQKSRRSTARFSAQGLRRPKSRSARPGVSSGAQAPLPPHGLWLNSIPSAEESKCLSAGYQPGTALSGIPCLVAPLIPKSSVERSPQHRILVLL